MAGQSAARRRHSEVLADIARFAGSSLELDEVLERIVERAAALTGADRSSIWLLDRSATGLLPSAMWGMDAAFTAQWKTRPLQLQDEPLSREVIESGEPVVVIDAAGDPRTDKRSVAFFGDQSILVAPLARHGRILGTLFLNHVRAPYAFTAEDVATTTVIASQAAIAIDNARLYGETRRLAEQLRRSFGYAGEALAAGVDLQSILQSMVQLAAETTAANGGELRLLDEGGRETYLVAFTGTPVEEGAATVAFPLRSEGRPLGTLALWRHALPFDDQERELLASFAGHARIALEHARLYARLQEEQERAQQAERTQADFVSMVSHELRTPLALIKAYVATLLQPSLPLSAQQHTSFLEGIDQAATRLQRLIDNLLSATSLDAGLFVSQPQPLELGALLREVLAEATMLAVDHPLQLELAPGEFWVLADRHQLTQVVQNLIGNAVKYSPAAAPVTVWLAPTGQHVRISVLDSGPGIPGEALELIFEKFYRVTVAHTGDPRLAGEDRESASRQPGGIGLGLYICQRIVAAHGGRIWAENLPTGGAAFHVELPRSAGDSPAPHGSTDHADPAAGDGVRAG
ncbi:MAG TPA: ATP-binding protein [Chloroflexota bacterium]|nr:ATP-binding protein [Chloroflexota bacterium]